ncbi:MAG: amidase [Bryobacteraceae bacterium]
MSQSADLCFLPAVELAKLLRAKKVSSREVLAAYLKQIERVNPKVNAIVTLVVEKAEAQAKLADESIAKGKLLGPLHGIPIAHKDLNETKGIRTTYGSRIFKDNVPDHDALIIERIRHAGAVTLGKTNTPEFGAGSQTFNEVFGRTLNPYDLTKTCGGSTGGGAVALACGMTALADGSDMGGSLRNPGSYCNVAGLRTAPGRVPKLSTTNAWATLSVDGPMARTVADLAFSLSVIAGPDPRSPISIEQPPAQFAAPLGRSFKGVRVAWFKDLGGVPFDPAIRAVIDAQRKTFEALGCIVEQAEPDFTGADEAFKTLRVLASVASRADDVHTRRSLVKDTVIWEVETGLKLTAAAISRAEVLHTQMYERFRRFFQKYDYFILPVTQVPPFDVTMPYPTEVAGVKMETYIDWMKSCYYISITGSPAASVPAGFTPEGLPVGIQIVGRHRDEWSVLQLAHAFESANASGKRRPAV